MTDPAEPTPADPSVFTRIIAGELPGRFVWRDPDVVAMLTIGPIQPGHTMVIPVAQVDHWLDVPADTWGRMALVQQAVGAALQHVFSPQRIGTMVLGMEVPHCHVHLVPIDHESDLSFANADQSPDPATMDADAESIRGALRAAGHGAHIPD
jgi:diadenosine tetraphosphate (Ap4A) HIT family hydrolase